MEPTMENFLKYRLKPMIEMIDSEKLGIRKMCPGAENFDGNEDPDDDIDGHDGWCIFCQKAVDVFNCCPCHELGCEEAELRARKAIENL